ncbi:DUF2497 domain-containing protein [Hyphomicrobium facile]|nr:DUF2497 domain-containing protein [Hyphomicrobium facile]
MSRLESTAEPSMEEILASIRKIIAEDSSGLRSPSAPPRPGAPFSPAMKTSPAPSPSAPTPQRGFMSREAFLKSSHPADTEPEIKPAHSFSNPAPSIDAEKPSRSRPAEDSRESGTAAAKAERRTPSFTPIEKNDFPAAEPAPTQRNGSASPEASPKSVTVESITIESISIETIAAQAEPIEPAVVVDATPVDVHPVVESDTARIEAQLAELLNDDLNALRQGRSAPAHDTVVGKEEGPAVSPSKTPSDAPSNEPADSVDPFAFDLGPSPFAKSEPKIELQPEAKADLKIEPKFEPKIEPKFEAKIEPKLEPKIEPKFEAKAEPKFEAKFEPKVEPARPIEAAPAPKPAMAPFEPPFANARPAYSGANETPVNGAANGSHASHAFEVSKSAGFGSSEAPASAQKPRQTFVVPSVSATLGPSRKLEPLSEAFRPSYGLSPPQQVLPTAELAPEPVAQQPVRSPEPVRTGQEPSAAPALRSESNESTLPATSLSNELTTGDRPMEDAVADLLRPLLKTWLAENMPKILERALRREMSERLLPGQKNPRD